MQISIKFCIQLNKKTENTFINSWKILRSNEKISTLCFQRYFGCVLHINNNQPAWNHRILNSEEKERYQKTKTWKKGILNWKKFQKWQKQNNTWYYINIVFCHLNGTLWPIFIYKYIRNLNISLKTVKRFQAMVIHQLQKIEFNIVFTIDLIKYSLAMNSPWRLLWQPQLCRCFVRRRLSEMVKNL